MRIEELPKISEREIDSLEGKILPFGNSVWSETVQYEFSLLSESELIEKYDETQEMQISLFRLLNENGRVSIYEASYDSWCIFEDVTSHFDICDILKFCESQEVVDKTSEFKEWYETLVEDDYDDH